MEISKIKPGNNILFQTIPYKVLNTSFSKMGRQGAVLRTKIKNLINGSVKEVTFHDSDRIDELTLERKTAQYLYKEGASYFFMDKEDFSQFSLDEQIIGEYKNFLLENSDVAIIYFNSDPINIELPIKMKFRVVEAPPSIRGDTASSSYKKVKIETNYMVDVPLFIKEGDQIVINTEEGEYVERV